MAQRLTEELTRWYREKAGEPHGRTGAIVVVQRFGSALNLNVHLHLLVLDGVYVEQADGTLRWRRVGAPTTAEVEALVERVASRIEAWLARRGHGREETEDEALHTEDATAVLQAASVQGRLALGRRAGRRARRVQVLGGRTFALPPRCATVDGYNLHGGVGVGAKDRRGLERLCRYLLRPAVPLGRLEERPDGSVALMLRRPWSDGTTALCFTPTELIERLVALVPPPHANQVLYYGVLAARSAWRSRVVPKPPRRRSQSLRLVRPPVTTSASRWTPWADLLRHVFDDDPLRCPHCGGRLVLRTVVLPPATLSILDGLARAARAPPAPLGRTA